MEGLFAAFWEHYVKARIPAQAFDKMNENFLWSVPKIKRFGDY